MRLYPSTLLKNPRFTARSLKILGSSHGRTQIEGLSWLPLVIICCFPSTMSQTSTTSCTSLCCGWVSPHLYAAFFGRWSPCWESPLLSSLGRPFYPQTSQVKPSAGTFISPPRRCHGRIELITIKQLQMLDDSPTFLTHSLIPEILLTSKCNMHGHSSSKSISNVIWYHE